MAKNKYLAYTDEQIENLINRVYHGKIDVYNLPKDLYEATVHRLSEAVIKGFGARVSELDDYKSSSLLMHYLHNTAVFSGAKTFSQIDVMQNSLYNPGTGIKIPLADFKEKAKAIFDDYNENYIQAEYNTAIAQAQAGRRWQGIEDNKESFPYLMYSTVGDARVREEHAEMDKIMLPVDDPFWSSNYPPNGWNCRCIVTQVEKDTDLKVTHLSKQDREDLLPSDLFNMNAGKDKLIFKEDHPYFNVADRYEKLKEDNFNLPIPPHPRDYVDAA